MFFMVVMTSLKTNHRNKGESQNGWVLQENKAQQIFQKTNIPYPRSPF